MAAISNDNPVWLTHMTLDKIDIKAAVADAERVLVNDPSISAPAKAALNLLLLIIKLMIDKSGKNSSNSSIPPSQDPYRKRERKTNGKLKPGGQPGRTGTTLLPVDTPDEIKTLKCNRRGLPPGTWKEVGFEKRQIFDLRISRHVTEYRAQILENEQGQRYVAAFPEGVTRPAQYGNSVKAHAVYLSIYQLLPYERVQSMFVEQYGIPLSVGSIANFNREAGELILPFEAVAKKTLIAEAVLHADETSINLGGTKHWLHAVSCGTFTLLSLAVQRGKEAMDAVGVLPEFKGTLVHDHWKPYYGYQCTHALCNAHHLRELTFAYEQDQQRWALNMHTMLLELNDAVTAAGGVLSPEEAKAWRTRYRKILGHGNTECPPPPEPDKPKRGKTKRSKSRNLLERLRDYEDDVLRFMEVPEVPFTNNQGERDIRMAKLHQKISGCFRSEESAHAFCRVRSYLSTCRKNSVDAGDALMQLFSGKWPEFIQEKIRFFDEGAE
jgi:transposase